MPRPGISAALQFKAPPSVLARLPPPLLRRALELKRLLDRKAEIAACEKSLATFLKLAWPAFDSSPYAANWHIDAIAEHLMAVSNGQIRRLLVNQPPRTGKTNLIAIAWPVWTWALEPNDFFPLHGPGVRFLCGSYGANKAEADGVTARRLIGSNWFQERWGERVQIAADRDNQGQYDTTAGGSRISTGIPESLGKGGAIRILDDANKVNEVESELVRSGINRAYDEIWRTRSNDPTNGAEVIVAQRLHENDLSGHVEREAGIVHLMLPMELDTHRRCHTVIGFTDPRKRDGDLLWPDRFNAQWATRQKALMGPHAWTGQFQQSPSTRGGGIVLRDWWKVWPPEGQEESWTQTVEIDGKSVERMLFPSLDYVLLSVDTAYTEKEENDFSACTVWGSFQLAGNPKIILLEAWRERLEMRALCMKILDTARRRKADAVMIESKASGLSVIQEMRRLMREGEFTLFGDVPKGDKVARLHAASPAFSAGLVYAPQRKWSDMVIDEVASFPRSRYADLTDSVSAGVNKLRRLGVVQQSDEVEAERNEALAFKGNQPTIRQEYGV
jgi:predicted phage terminase large subunit-like protein